MERLLSPQQVTRALERLFRVVRADLSAAEPLAVIGIRTRGEVLARRIVEHLRARRERPVDFGVLDITFYRDDLSLRKGMPLGEACIDAGAVRFRPMFLTASAVFVGSSVILLDPIFQGMAISLMMGTLLSTILTVIVIPLAYYLYKK